MVAISRRLMGLILVMSVFDWFCCFHFHYGRMNNDPTGPILTCHLLHSISEKGLMMLRRSELLQQHGSEYWCIFWCILSDRLTVVFNRAVLSVTLIDNQFRMSILERLEQMERRMAEMASHQQSSSAGSGGTGGGTVGGGGGGGGNNSQSQVKTHILLPNSM